MDYNVKELAKGIISNPDIQKLHYVDDKGALTFTSGACVNNFNLPKPIKILLNNKIVKLPRLRSNDKALYFVYGNNQISSKGKRIIATKNFMDKLPDEYKLYIR